VYRIRHAGDVSCGCPDGFDVEIVAAGERFAYVHHPLDVLQVLDSFCPLGRWGGDDEQDLQLEVGGLVLYLWMIAFDNAGGFQFVNPVPDGAWGHASFVADLLGRGIPGIQLEQVENATVDVVQVWGHTPLSVGQAHVGWDRSRIDRLFHQSGSMREKWDEVHYADGSTYGEKTIERAIAGVSEYYDPEAAEESDSMTKPTGTGSGGQRHAHLAEKNRLLTERVSELETKKERIVELEAELDRLDAR